MEAFIPYGKAAKAVYDEVTDPSRFGAAASARRDLRSRSKANVLKAKSNAAQARFYRRRAQCSEEREIADNLVSMAELQLSDAEAGLKRANGHFVAAKAFLSAGNGEKRSAETANGIFADYDKILSGLKDMRLSVGDDPPPRYTKNAVTDSPVCTRRSAPFRQYFKQCITCFSGSSIECHKVRNIGCTLVLCEPCAEHCHAGHDIINWGWSSPNGFCDCFDCQIMGKDRPAVMSWNGTRCTRLFAPLKQHFKQCLTCFSPSSFLVGGEKFVHVLCLPCASKCHSGHTVVEYGLGSSGGFCDCFSCLLQ